MLTLFAIALLQDLPYSVIFQEGLQALERGEQQVAVERFLSAGELAPDAPLWRLYAARAGADPEPPPRRSPSSTPWRSTLDPRMDYLQFSADDQRVLSRVSEASLWDVPSGELVAQLESTAERLLHWTFDHTGRVVIGWNPIDRPGGRAGIEVRDARTGELWSFDSSDQLRLSSEAMFEWLPRPQPSETSPWYTCMDLTLQSGGVLRIRNPRSAGHSRVHWSLENRRAILVERGAGFRFVLVDLDSPEPLAEVTEGGWRCSLSPSGRTAGIRGEQGLVLLDTATGERLPAPPMASGLNMRKWGFAFQGDDVFLVTSAGSLVHWDPRAASVLETASLEPAPQGDLRVLGWNPGGLLLIIDREGLRAHNPKSGRAQWTVPGWFGFGVSPSPAGGLLPPAFQARSVLCIDSRDGTAVERVAIPPFRLTDLGTTSKGDRAVAAAADGSLRLIDLETGACLGAVSAHAPGRIRRLESLAGGRVLTSGEGAGVRLWDENTLELLAEVSARSGERLWASSPDGLLHLFQADTGPLRIASTQSAAPDRILASGDRRLSAAVWSSDRSALAVAFGGAIELWLPADKDRPSHAFQLQGDPKTGAMTFHRVDLRMAFHGSQTLCVGWGNRADALPAMGVDVFDWRTGRRLARHSPSEPLLTDGWISDLVSDPSANTVLYSVKAAGIAIALDDDDWRAKWAIDYSGGNQSDLLIRRRPGQPRTYLSGMSGQFARVVQQATGQVVAKAQVEGCFQLQPSSSGKYVVALRDGELVCFDAESMTELWTRSEGSGDLGWIQRPGAPVQRLGQAAPGAAVRHITRNGISLPLDCWAPWTLDPLGLGTLELRSLPEPPRISSGPPRVLDEEGGSVVLELYATDPRGLRGLEVWSAGREPVLLPVPEQSSGRGSAILQATVSGPWPRDFQLRAVSNTGARSSPWRVRIR